jgi:hypothetical protein
MPGIPRAAHFRLKLAFFPRLGFSGDLLNDWRLVVMRARKTRWGKRATGPRQDIMISQIAVPLFELGKVRYSRLCQTMPSPEGAIGGSLGI